jgi:hypothetical protein
MHKKLVAAFGLSAVIWLVPPAHGQTTPSSVSPPWQFTDVGAVGIAGNAQQPSPFSGMTVSGAGSDIWGTGDGFAFVHQPLRDGGVFANLTSEGNTNPFAKAGVMIRQTSWDRSRRIRIR